MAVELGWFVYTLAVMLVAVVACAVSIMMWVLTNRKRSLVAAGIFALYFFEVALILFEEYSGAKPTAEQFFSQGLAYPALSVAVSVALMGLVWQWLHLRSHHRVKLPATLAFMAFFGIGSALLAPWQLNASQLHQVVYWEFRDLTLAGCLLATYLWYRKASKNEQLDMERSRTTFEIACILVLLMCLEDAYTILFMEQPAPGSWYYSFVWHWSQRNFSENLLMIWCAVRLVGQAHQEMGVFGRHPVPPVTAAQQDEGAGYERRIALKMPHFCETYGVSQREADVMALVAQGKTVQEIADALFISPGTVKTHLHRIYVKTQAPNREELVAAFWRL